MQHLPLFFQPHELLEGRLPIGIGEPGVVPDVQLLHVQGVHPQVLERLLRAGSDVLRREHVAERVARLAGPLAVLRRDLGGDHNPIAANLVFQRLTDHALAVAAAVRERGVEERDALIECLAQRAPSLGVVYAAPHLAADAPGAEADFGDTVSGVAECSLFHRSVPI